MSKKERFIAKLIMTVSAFIGRISMLIFLIFLFIGSLHLYEMRLSEKAVLLWDGMLSVVFFVQHSCMIRRRFRQRLSKIIQPHYNDAFFALFSSVVLITVVIFWQPSATVLYELHGFPRWAARGIFFLAIAGLGWGVSALKSFDPFGRTPIRDHLRGKSSRSPQFAVHGAYVWVRHPLYFFVLLLIWSSPDLTVDRLLFNFLWTVWIYIGTILEEKDLVSDFGDDYRQYQCKVPMLIPCKGPIYKGSGCIQHSEARHFIDILRRDNKK